MATGRSRRDKLKLAVKRYVEAEIRDYHETKQQIAAALSEVAERSPMPLDGSSVSSRNKVTRPTERGAVVLLTNRRLQQMERTVRAIEKVLDMLDEEKREFVRMRWWERKLTPTGIAEKLHIDERTVYRWQNEVIALVAVEMGLMNAADLL